MAPAENLPKMQYRFLGRSGLQVSVISLGGWVTYGGQVGDQIAFDCMKAAYDAGINFFDCAEAYAAGKSEEVMGQAIKKFGWKRNDLVISTKINWGGAFGDNPVNNGGLSRKHLIEGTEAALQRLGLSCELSPCVATREEVCDWKRNSANLSLTINSAIDVDLLYCHRPDRNTPIEETVRAMNYLINSGKALYWGTSEWNSEELAMAWAVANRLNLIGPVMEQPQYNMLCREKVEKEYSLIIENYGLGLTIFSPLKTGILSGKYNDGIPEDSRYATATDAYTSSQAKTYGDEKWRKEIAQVRSLKPIADKLGCDQAALALAWVVKNPHVSSAITGASKVEQVIKSVKSLEILPKLTEEIMKEIDDVLGNKPEPLIRRF